MEMSREAGSAGELRKSLEKEGYFVLKIRGASRSRMPGSASVKTSDFFSFNQEFSVLLGAGLSVIAALDAILEGDDGGRLFVILREIRTAIVRGESLSSAFARYSDVFSGLYVASLRAGEKSGDIPLAIMRYIDYMKRNRAVRQKVVSATVYPLILTVVSILVLVFLLVFVVPSITTTFLETGSKLPGPTAFLLAVSSGFRRGGPYLLFFGVLLAAGGLRWWKTPGGALFIDRMKMTLPFLSELNRSYATTRLCRTLSTVLSGGTTLVESVRISSETVDNRFLEKKLKMVGKRVEEGEGFAGSLGGAAVFPGLAVRLIAAGEAGGDLVKVLEDIAEYYEADVDARLTVLTSAMEPVLMVVMGCLIGFIVLAMYMPVFQMAGTLG